MCGGDALLEASQIGCQCGLISHSRRDSSKQSRHLRVGLQAVLHIFANKMHWQTIHFALDSILVLLTRCQQSFA